MLNALTVGSTCTIPSILNGHRCFQNSFKLLQILFSHTVDCTSQTCVCLLLLNTTYSTQFANSKYCNAKLLAPALEIKQKKHHLFDSILGHFSPTVFMVIGASTSRMKLCFLCWVKPQTQNTDDTRPCFGTRLPIGIGMGVIVKMNGRASCSLQDVCYEVVRHCSSSHPC